MAETVVLDPAAVATGRTELDITQFVAESGPDWGESTTNQHKAEAESGEVPVGFRRPNRTIQIPLVLHDWDGYTLEEIRAAVQAKAALFQEEGGWISRQTAVGTLYADVVNASLTLGASTAAALGFVDADAVLTLEALPDFYGDEIDLGDNITTTDGELVWVENTIEGNHPGRLRVVVDDDQGMEQRGLLWAVRCRHYSDAPTAASSYEAEDLTPVSPAAVITLTGASGGAADNAVRHLELTTNWTPVLDLDHAVEGPLTHTGTCRVLARVHHALSDTNPQLRLVWDVGDLAFPEENRPVAVPAHNQLFIVDLGEVRLDASPSGAHYWKGVIQGKADDGALAPSVSIDKVWVLPVVEGYGVLRSTPSPEVGAAGVSAQDGFDQTAGALHNKDLPIGGFWTTSGDADDYQVSGAGEVTRTAVSDADARYAIAGSTEFTDVVVQVDAKISAFPGTDVQSGVIAHWADINNFVHAALSWGDAEDSVSVFVAKRVAGSFTTIFTRPLRAMLPDFEADTYYTLRLLVTAGGAVFVWVFEQGANPGPPVLVEQDADLATGGALPSGESGIYDIRGAAGAMTRTYDNFLTFVPAVDAIAFPNRSVELTTDGMFREVPAGGTFRKIPHVQGDLPRIPPSGPEARPVELFVKLSQGDFDQLPDLAIDDQSAQAFYRPCWLTVPG